MLCVSTLVASDVFHTFSTLRRTRVLKRSFSIRFEWRSVPCRRLQHTTQHTTHNTQHTTTTIHNDNTTQLCLRSDVGALAGGASDSVHRRGWWTFQLQRQWASSRVGGDEGVGAHHTGDELY